MKVFDEVQRISLFVNPRDLHAMCKALVAEFTATPYLEFTCLQISFSNFSIFGPVVNQSEVKVLTTFLTSELSMTCRLYLIAII